jgi:hypothetical protein
LPTVLADHTVPVGGAGTPPGSDYAERPSATLAACVHTDDYGTRSAALVRVPSDPDSRPKMLVADGPCCVTSFVDVSDRWT